MMVLVADENTATVAECMRQPDAPFAGSRACTGRANSACCARQFFSIFFDNPQ